MKISNELMKFRKDRAQELDNVERLLTQYIPSINCSPLRKAISSLRDKKKWIRFKDKSRDANTWGYDIRDLTFKLPETRHIQPAGIKGLEVFFSIKVIANYQDWGTPNDPLKELSFRVLIRGVGDKIAHTGFHIDRHESENPINGEIHPSYHFQNSVNLNNDDLFEYGSVLSMDAPRIMHYPMDFILGIGFLTANFCPDYYEKLLNSHPYPRYLKEYQERIWKPYAHLMCSHWKSPFSASMTPLNWNPKQICPYLQD